VIFASATKDFAFGPGATKLSPIRVILELTEDAAIADAGTPGCGPVAAKGFAEAAVVLVGGDTLTEVTLDLVLNARIELVEG